MRQVTTEQRGGDWVVKVGGVVVASEPTQWHADTKADEYRRDLRGTKPVVPLSRLPPAPSAPVKGVE